MSSASTSAATARLDRILADAKRDKEMGYRDKALKMYPHVCGRCAREFSGKRLSELTVHHRDHNHDNNPQDGSNWELLCLYCHDNEHSRYTDQQYFSEGSTSTPSIAKATHNPFAGLAGMLKKTDRHAKPRCCRQARIIALFFPKGPGTWQTNGTAASACSTQSLRRTSVR